MLLYTPETQYSIDITSLINSHLVNDSTETNHLSASFSYEFWLKKKDMNIMHLNTHYLHSKLDEFKILLSQQINIDILCLCETFLNNKFNDQELHLDGYQLFCRDRVSNWGGLAVNTKTNLNCKPRDDLQKEGNEALSLEVYMKVKNLFSVHIRIGHPPPAKHGLWSSNLF